MKNTEPSFYILWSREQLIAELVRMNSLLDSIDEDIEKAAKALHI